MNTILALPLQLIVPGAFLLALLLGFIGLFLVPASVYWIRLIRIQRRIKTIKGIDPKIAATEFKSIFKNDQRLAHLWKEYQDSLHRLREDRNGQMTDTDFRATLPAETYFNREYLVDGRLGTEFFKHLPGIFTGIGIIGTFYGLIAGLRQFQLSENPATVRDSLESLMHHVGQAFVVSATAITAAMVVTFLEKILLSALYRRTEEIAQAIDASFVSGAGEEYLSRLVKASEDSASQSKILKDALVKELGKLLQDLTDAQIANFKEQQAQLAARLTETSQRQVEAARADTQALGTTIAKSIEESLKGPLQEIATTVKAASGDQSAAAVRMLQDVMASFSQRLNDLFGGQISGLNDLNRQTAQSIQTVAGTLQSLVTSLEESGRRSTDAMAQKMADAVSKLEARQDAMNQQTEAFVDQLRQLVAASQSETQIKLQATLETIGSTVNNMLSTLAASQRQVFESSREREQTMSARTSSVVSAMSESMEAAIAEIGAATNQMARSVTALTQLTGISIEKISAGASELHAAAHTFAQAGDRVSSVMAQAALASEKLSQSSISLTSGAAAIQELLTDYRAQRSALEQLMSEVRATVEGARREASLTSDVLSRIESSAQRLAVAQKQADEYLAGVSEVLGRAHSAFTEELTKTLGKANYEFHAKLTSAVQMLSTAVEELGVTLDTAVAAAPSRR